LIITDEIVDDDLLQNSVVYRPPSLVVGVGLHWDTTKETIKDGLMSCMNKFKLGEKSIARFVSIKKEKDVVGLVELAKEMSIHIQYFEKEELASIATPNPSNTVQTFEGTSLLLLLHQIHRIQSKHLRVHQVCRKLQQLGALKEN